MILSLISSFDMTKLSTSAQLVNWELAPGDDNVVNEFYIHGLCENLVVVLSYFFNLIISFGYVPEKFNVALLTPIP